MRLGSGGQNVRGSHPGLMRHVFRTRPRVPSRSGRSLPRPESCCSAQPALLVGLFLTSLLFWIPQIVNSSGLSGSIMETGVLVMLPYALSLVVMYLWARRSTGSLNPGGMWQFP